MTDDKYSIANAQFVGLHNYYSDEGGGVGNNDYDNTGCGGDIKGDDNDDDDDDDDNHEE